MTVYSWKILIIQCIENKQFPFKDQLFSQLILKVQYKALLKEKISTEGDLTEANSVNQEDRLFPFLTNS